MISSSNAISSDVVRVAFVVPHIFMCDYIRDGVIFSPGDLAIDICNGIYGSNINITLFSPGSVRSVPKNITADMSLFNKELEGRGYGYKELLRKHPAVFVAMARQVQAEVIAKAYKMANDGLFDVVHVYTNEEDLALQFATFCRKPVLFTHHDPFNFLIKYKSVFPKYKKLNWISISNSQRNTMPEGTNWVAGIYHGLDPMKYNPRYVVDSEYVAYIGRIIESKGVHLAIKAVRLYNEQNPNRKVKLRIAGRHYSDGKKDDYWQTKIAPFLDDDIEYVGYLKGDKKLEFLRGATGLLVPSTFDEPFGLVTIEALASGTPVIGLNIGATPEIVEHGKSGFIVKQLSEVKRVTEMVRYIGMLDSIDRRTCRDRFEEKFTLDRMISEHASLYRKMAK